LGVVIPREGCKLKDRRFERRVIDVFWVLGGPLLVTVDEPGFGLAEVLEGFLAMLN